ncbi:MAG: hypothetical protein WBB13_17965 [Tabrizicola sp.]
MRDENEGLFVVAIIALGFYSYYTADLPYIDNVKASEDDEYGETYILAKGGSGQVAVFHGFANDFEVCEIVRLRLEADGGTYVCTPASSIEAPPSWWQFWK